VLPKIISLTFFEENGIINTYEKALMKDKYPVHRREERIRHGLKADLGKAWGNIPPLECHRNQGVSGRFRYQTAK
jgi:hypothetical protein